MIGLSITTINVLKLLKNCGNNHPDFATAYNNIGIVNNTKWELYKAIDCINKCLEIGFKIFGDNNKDTANAYKNIWMVYNTKFKKTIGFRLLW